MKNSVLLLLFVVLVVSCSTSRLKKDLKIENFSAPPGTTALSENHFIDQTETTNYHWNEYLFWVGRVYGKDSKEYLQALPDTSVWVKLHWRYQGQEEFYLSHPAYRAYPVVGISYEQAVKYCKWRSDRVMEYLLIKYGVLEWNIDAPADSVFTIEKYFRGEYYGIQANPHFMFYPHYSLPDFGTYRKVIPFADSLNTRNGRSCRKKYCNLNDLIGRTCKEDLLDIELFPYSPDPTKEVCCWEWACKKDLITHLKGNVREMTDQPGVFFGASFMDSCSVSDYVWRRDSLSVNSFTGFRAKCEYRKWGE